MRVPLEGTPQTASGSLRQWSGKEGHVQRETWSRAAQQTGENGSRRNCTQSDPHHLKESRHIPSSPRPWRYHSQEGKSVQAKWSSSITHSESKDSILLRKKKKCDHDNVRENQGWWQCLGMKHTVIDCNRGEWPCNVCVWTSLETRNLTGFSFDLYVYLFRFDLYGVIHPD